MRRRRFLKLGVAGLLSMAAGRTLAAMPDRTLSLYNIHTGEQLNTTYWADGVYVAASLDEINHVLRDYRTNETMNMDSRLLDLLHAVRSMLGGSLPFHVISGYRSAATNAYLAETSSGVARKSLHMKGQAADIFLPGSDLPSLRRAALDLNLGGVGYYPRSNFVHVDVGRVRAWQG
ncbi:MAG: DUF882 domain-containing protein [Burkholderiales bacterium]|nr:DUF882 domain-containing protein [Burkholderiales bacterium]